MPRKSMYYCLHGVDELMTMLLDRQQQGHFLIFLEFEKYDAIIVYDLIRLD